MSSTEPSTSTKPLKRGTWAPAPPNSLRSPCPAVNSLANMGYISRDGRNIRANEIFSALNEFGISHVLAGIFTYPVYVEAPDSTAPPPTLWHRLTNPFSTAFKYFGMRHPGQKDSEGIPVLNLDQLDRPHSVEHDISLARFDYAQGDNHTAQPELINDMLSSSTNGTTITISDFANLRKRRIERQRRDNPECNYEALQHQIACSEISLILKVFGDGKEVPVEYVRAFFKEERLPREEGWQKRKWWTVGLVELNIMASKVKALIGDYGGGKKVPLVAAVH